MGELHDSHGQRKYLNAEERQAFETAAQDTGDLTRKAFLLVSLHTGARPSELLALTWDRIDLAEGCVVLRTLKQRGRKRFRAIPLPPDVIQLLQTLKQDNRRIWSFCRTTAWKIVKDTMARAELDHLPAASPKGLRHGLAMAAISEGVRLPVIQAILGHSSLQTTGEYLKHDLAAQRREIEKVWRQTSKPE